MKSSTFRLSSRRVMPAAVALLCLAAAGCPKGGDTPGTTAPASSGGKAISLSVTVNGADAQNRRSAAVKLDAPAPLPDGQLMFELPKECQIVAGAAVRPVKNLGHGSVSQELAFECPPGTAGELKATFKGTDSAGKPLEEMATGKLM